MVDKETHFSSFFMVLLSATSLVVILSNFFSGNFSHRTSAMESSAMPYIEDDYFMEDPVNEEYPEETIIEEFPEDVSLENDMIEETPTVELHEEVEVDL